MQTVVIIAERVTESSLSAVIPAEGVAAVRVMRNTSQGRSSSAATGYRSFRNPLSFVPAVRIELLTDADDSETIFDAVAVAHGAGFFSDAEMWVEFPVLSLSA